MANEDAPRQTLVTHAPSPNYTPPGRGTSEINIPRAESDTVTVQLTTLHNWMELVYKAFGFKMPTGPRELALLGVREASIRGIGASADTKSVELEAKAEEGDLDDVEFTRVERAAEVTRGGPTETKWDDLLFAAWTDTDAAKTQHVDVYQCTIDSSLPANSAGIPHVLEGKLYKCYPSFHRPTKYKGNDIALHIYSSKKGLCLLAREGTNSLRIFKTLASTNTANGKFVREESNDTIHMHFGSSTSGTWGYKKGSKTQTWAWSEGCTVLKHHKDSPRYQHFRGLFNGSSNKEEIPYVIASSEYLRSYGEWVKEVDKTPGATPEPKTVILKDQLRSPNGKPGKYLPSIFTTEFANTVLARGDAVRKSSLELALFSVSI